MAAAKVDPDAVYRRLLDNITAWLSDPGVTFPSGTCIPQRPYCQGTPIPGDTPGQRIMFAMDNGNCFPAEDALAERFDLLVDGTSTVFSDQNQTINMRVEWPGYNGWVAQIRIVNYQGDPKGINRAKLVKEIAKQLKNFIEKMQSTIIDPGYEQWRVGPGGIELRNIHIAALERVSRGSWQPRFIYNR